VSASLSKLFPSPAGKGATSRILNGRLYLADVPFDSDAEAEARAPLFARRAGHYFEHWAELSDNWVRKVTELTAELEAIEVPELPELEDEDVVLQGHGINSGYRLLAAYALLVDNLFLVYQYHFEMLPLGYFAQINLREFCLQAFPGISEQAISDLTAGVELMQFRPDEELKRLAARAVELGIGRQVRISEDPEATLAELGGLPQGREWVAEFESARDTWFSVSMGTGLFHHERAWSDDLSVPWTALAGYVTRIDRGETLARPRDELLERRDRMTTEYRALLASDAQRATFDDSLALARLVGPHLQDHNFYIEHRHHSVFWNKMRAVADRMVGAGVLAERDDLFYLNRWEVGQALYDAVYGWASSGSTRHAHWQATIARRKGIVTALRSWIPEPALGPVPDDLGGLVGPQFGITPEAVERWLGEDDGRPDELRGVPASPGRVEGRVRIVLSPAQIPEVGTGEILVCPATAPAWAPVFAHVGAVVSDVGGTMSHAAILCREYGIPAVLGTGHATRRVATGDLVRVDGAAGTVTILDRASAA
jgi:pyruvate,water dikinase